jgi:cysteine desulfurase
MYKVMENPVYLDYNATTPIDAEVIDAMQPYLQYHFGNPSSTHSYGTKTRLAVEAARRQIAALINCFHDELVFTGGGTEANNYALKGAAFQLRHKGNHIITTQIEHPAVNEVCGYLQSQGFAITWLPVNSEGLIDMNDLENAITPATILVSVMHANNETGVIQPIEAIGQITRARGILFHCDAAQSAGKIPVDVQKIQVDLLSLAGHKFYAPKGVGALYMRRGIKLQKMMHGAAHEQNRRAGTENIASVAGMGKAAEIALRDMNNNSTQMRTMRDLLHNLLQTELPGIRLNGHAELRLPNTLNISFPGIDANVLLDELTGIAASAGAACHSDSIDISPVLQAMNIPIEFARGTIRFSTGKYSTEAEIRDAAQMIIQIVKQLTHAVGSDEPSNFQTDFHPANNIGDSSVSSVNSNENPIRPDFTGDDFSGGNTSGFTADLSSAESVKLTRYTQGLGCACKIRPQYLEKVLQDLPPVFDPNVIVGTSTSDDAAVYRINDDTAIVQTVDFFTPVVDDPYTFGAIAAANALSDIYAMGAKPLFALNIVGFPSNRLPMQVLKDILRGAADKAAEAGISILGGHTIEDPEPKFGMVVTGVVHPGKVLTNCGTQPGDVLVLTKPIGTGIISTAVKRNLAGTSIAARAAEVMSTLNNKAAQLMTFYKVNACTDVTGFGLMGHLNEMIGSSEVSCIIHARRVPVINGVYELAMAGAIPGGSRNNLAFVDKHILWDFNLPEIHKLILCDAQTSGGLLIALAPSAAANYIGELKAQHHIDAVIIGEVVEKEMWRIKVES